MSTEPSETTQTQLETTANPENNKLKPVRQRSEKQIAWSKELGKRSQELKRKKRERLQQLENQQQENQEEKNEEKNITITEEVEEEKPKNDNNNLLLLGGGIITGVVIGGIYYLNKRKVVKPDKTPIKHGSAGQEVKPYASKPEKTATVFEME